jgi:hypothetical protein
MAKKTTKKKKTIEKVEEEEVQIFELSTTKNESYEIILTLEKIQRAFKLKSFNSLTFKEENGNITINFTLRGNSINDDIHNEIIEIDITNRKLNWKKVNSQLIYYYAPETLEFKANQRIADFFFIRYLKSALSWTGNDEIHCKGRRNYMWKNEKST